MNNENFVICYDRLENKYICIKPKDMFNYTYNISEITPRTVIPRLKCVANVPSMKVGLEFIKEPEIQH